MLFSGALSRRAGVPVVLKCENLQRTGSFKIRGAAARLQALTAAERTRGVVTCSSGNHGHAVACIGRQLDVPVTVCVPEWVDSSKREGMERYGARVVAAGTTFDDAEVQALEVCAREHRIYISAFDDPLVIAGQGTIGLELLEQCPDLTTVVVPMSGGGLVSGIGLAVREQGVDVVAVSASAARVMYESVRAGRVVVRDEEPTLASALAGGIGRPNRYSLDLVRRVVDHHYLVGEPALATGMALAARAHRLVVEGGGAAGLAAVLDGWRPARKGTVAVVVSGGNIDPSTWLETVAAVPRDSR